MTKDKALDLALAALLRSRKAVAGDYDLASCAYGSNDPDGHRYQDAKKTVESVKEAITAIKQARSAPVQEPVGVYGHCPVCGAKGITRERRPGGDDRCANGHTYKSIHATTPPTAQRQWVGLDDDDISALGLSIAKAKALESLLKRKNT
jgi:hypothetical protein